MTYAEIRENHQKEISKTIERNGVFFAFSNEQFEKNKGDLKLEELARVGVTGGYMPKKNVHQFKKEVEELEKKRREAIKKINPEEVILDELKNHEAFYSGDIEDAFDVLRDYGFTFEQVYQVYKKYNEKHND